MEKLKDILQLEEPQIESLWDIVNKDNGETVDLDEIEDLLDMIYSENVEEENLENDELLEILDIVNKEAFKQTEVMKVGFKEIEQIVTSIAPDHKTQILALLSTIKQSNSISRVSLQDLIHQTEDNALKENLNSTNLTSLTSSSFQNLQNSQNFQNSQNLQNSQNFKKTDDSYIIRGSIFKNVSSNDSKTNLTLELDFCDKLRLQFEKFIQDLEFFNASKKDPKIVNLLKMMERYNDDLSRFGIFIRDRHNSIKFIEENSKNEREDLELRVKELERDLEKQLELNNKLGDELNEIFVKEKNEKEENENFFNFGNNRKKTDFMIIEDFNKDIQEYSSRIRDLEDENAKLEAELNQKFFDIGELKSEIKNLNSKMANLMDMKMSENEQNSPKKNSKKNFEDLKEAFRDSNALLEKANRMSERKGSIASNQSFYKERAEELEELLNEERVFISNLKMELEGLKKKNEELEDKLLEKGAFNPEGVGRLDSNLLYSNFDVDDDILESGIGDSLMSVEFGKQTQIRKVRDHKNIQVDLVMANVIVEEEEMEFEIMKINLCFGENGVVENAKVVFLYNEEIGEVVIKQGKITVEGSQFLVKREEVVKEVKDDGLKEEILSKEKEVKSLEEELRKARDCEQEWYDRCSKLQTVLDGVVGDGEKVSQVELDGVRRELGKVIREKEEEIEKLRRERERKEKLEKEEKERKEREEREKKERKESVVIVEEKVKEEEEIRDAVEDKGEDLEDEVKEEKVEEEKRKSEVIRVGGEMEEEGVVEEGLIREKTEEVEINQEEEEQMVEETKSPVRTPLPQEPQTLEVTTETLKITPPQKKPQTPKKTENFQKTQIVQNPEIDTLSKEIKNLKSELIEVKSREDKWFQKCTQLQKQLETLTPLQENPSESPSKSELITEKNTLISKISTLETKISELEKSLKTQEKNFELKETEIKNLETEIEFNKKNYKELKNSYLEKIGFLETMIEKMKEEGEGGERGNIMQRLEEGEGINQVAEKIKRLEDDGENLEKREEEFKKEKEKKVMKDNIKGILKTATKPKPPKQKVNFTSPSPSTSSPKEERGYDLYDFINLRKNKSVIKLIKSQGENQEPKIFSDYVTRINSNCERKLRVCVVSGKCFFVLYPKNKSGVYKLKYISMLSLITKITICRKNSTLIKLSVKNMADQLIESFRRNSLVLFLKKACKKYGHDLKIYKTDKLTFVNKHHKKRVLSIRVEEMFKPEFQDMFMVSEKSGFLKVIRSGVVSSKFDDYAIVLTNCGLLCLDPIKFDTKKFIPLHGTRLMDWKSKDKKDNELHGVKIVFSRNQNNEIIVFGSVKEKQEWVTKIRKIQESSIFR